MDTVLQMIFNLLEQHPLYDDKEYYKNILIGSKYFDCLGNESCMCTVRAHFHHERGEL